jgi:hypothetical protein
VELYYWITEHHLPEGTNLHIHSENLKSHSHFSLLSVLTGTRLWQAYHTTVQLAVSWNQNLTAANTVQLAVSLYQNLRPCTQCNCLSARIKTYGRAHSATACQPESKLTAVHTVQLAVSWNQNLPRRTITTASSYI